MQDLSCCGTDCSSCGCYGNMCAGCNACEGKVFHAPEGKACSIYECVINKNKFKNCGQCGEIPCLIWKNTRDPQFSDEEFAENVNRRVRALKQN